MVVVGGGREGWVGGWGGMVVCVCVCVLGGGEREEGWSGVVGGGVVVVVVCVWERRRGEGEEVVMVVRTRH